MKLNRPIVIGSIAGGILLLIIGYSIIGGNTNENNEGKIGEIGKNQFGDYITGINGEKAPLFGGNKKKSTKKYKKNTKKNKTVNKK
jgi:hypothetical protein